MAYYDFSLYSFLLSLKYRGKIRVTKTPLKIAVREILLIMLFPLRIHDHKLSNCDSNTPKLSACVCILRMNSLFKNFHAQKVAF